MFLENAAIKINLAALEALNCQALLLARMIGNINFDDSGRISPNVDLAEDVRMGGHAHLMEYIIQLK